MTQRLHPVDRSNALLTVALEVAAASGWRTLTREAIAAAAGCSPALVSARLGTATAMRRAVMRQAIARRVIRIVAEGLAIDDPHARRADPELKRLAAEWVRQ